MGLIDIYRTSSYRHRMHFFHQCTKFFPGLITPLAKKQAAGKKNQIFLRLSWSETKRPASQNTPEIMQYTLSLDKMLLNVQRIIGEIKEEIKNVP